jgi:hypothetical protein
MTRQLPILCGTCNHEHTLGGCPACEGEGAECTGIVPHPDVIAAGDEREIRELATIGGNPILDIAASDGLLQVLVALEEDIHIADQGNQLPPERRVPHLFALGIGEPATDLVTSTRTITTKYVGVPDELWTHGTRAEDLVNVAAQYAARYAEPTVCWALAAYGVVSAGPDAPGRDAHVLCATDIDGRVYTVARYSDDNTRDADINVAPGWAQFMRGDLDPDHPDAVEILRADGVSRGHLATCQLMASTRSLMEYAGRDGAA